MKILLMMMKKGKLEEYDCLTLHLSDKEEFCIYRPWKCNAILTFEEEDRP